jgi:uncharacterized HAD superfamily protein
MKVANQFGSVIQNVLNVAVHTTNGLKIERNRMKTFGFDIDGVLYDWGTAVYNYCTTSGIAPKMPAMEFWLDWGNKKNALFWDNMYRMPTLCNVNMPTKSLVKWVQDFGKRYNILYITARPTEVQRVTIKYLTDNGFPNPEDVFFTNDKASVICSHDVFGFVDDKPSNADSLAKHCKSFLLDNPLWGMVSNDPRVIKINTLQELDLYV